MQSQAPPIQEAPEVLEAECIALVTSLFQTKNVHPIKLDGKEIEPIKARLPGLSTVLSFHQRPHALHCRGQAHLHVLHLHRLRGDAEEQLVIQDDTITAVLINTFDYAGIRTSAPGHESWRSDLYHMREVLMEAVERCA